MGAGQVSPSLLLFALCPSPFSWLECDVTVGALAVVLAQRRGQTVEPGLLMAP